MIRRTITFTVIVDGENGKEDRNKLHQLSYITGRWLYETLDWMREDLELIVDDKEVFDPDARHDLKEKKQSE